MVAMDDLEKFDSTSYGGEVEFEDESVLGKVTGIIGPLKKFLPHIIAVIVIIAVAWFAYDFFIGSTVNVTVTVKDTEGRVLNESSIKVYPEGTSEAIFKESGSASYSFTVRPGRYRYEAISPGYVTKKSAFDISQDTKEQVIELEKDVGVEILDFEQVFPQKLYVGGTSTIQVQLKNSSSATASVELVAEKDLEGILQASPVSIPAGMTQTVSMQVSIPAGTAVKDQTNGDQKEAALRIRYTNEEASAAFTLYPNPAEKIALDSASFSAKARENENKDSDIIAVKNNNSFPIDDLTLSIEITSATKNSPSDVIRWFQFTEVANEQDPREIEITTIPAKKDVKKELQVVIPLTAKKEPDIKGNIVLNAPWLSEPIKKTLTLDVKEEASYSLEISTNPRSPIEIEWDETLGKYEDLMINLRVKNAGQLDLHNIVFSIANNIICSPDWLLLVENSIDVLGPGETKELKMNASSPIAMRGQESSKFCNIRYRFDNPIATGSYIEDTEVSLIEIAPQPA